MSLFIKDSIPASNKQNQRLLNYLLSAIALTLIVLSCYVGVIHYSNIFILNLQHHITILNHNIEINTTIDIVDKSYQSLNDFRAVPIKKTPGQRHCDYEKDKLQQEINRTWNNFYETNEEVNLYLDGLCERRRKCKPNLKGFYHINVSEVLLRDLHHNSSLVTVQNGGWWQPNCREIKKVAIIVPYRNRSEHLAIFLRHMHPYLQRQQLHYRIFIIDQVDNFPFNRGKLLNVGFEEALKQFPYDCFVFHDVDLLPEDGRNSYGCPSSPQHMCVAIDKYNYRLLYEELFGGVEMFSKEHFKLINGFSNSFWGWGAEDDNLYKRLLWKKIHLWRQMHEVGKYKMLKHVSQEPLANPNRTKFLLESRKHFSTDGLVNLQYEIKETKDEKLFTHIKVNLHRNKDKIFGVHKIFG